MAILTVWKGSSRCDVEFQPPQRLDPLLNQIGYLADRPCGGRGTCGKCKVRIRTQLSERQAEDHLRCQTVLTGDCEVWLPEDTGLPSVEKAVPETGFHTVSLGAAIDIGTTTIAVALYDLDTGNSLSECMANNPQRSVSADVMGRIQAALTGSGQMLQDQVLAGLKRLLINACELAGCRIEYLQRMVIVGNTTMLYLLLGRSPESLATAPFHADDLFGREEVVLSHPVLLPPCMTAFVGADTTAAVLASGMCRHGETSMLCDIGTNGELALWKNGTLYVTSTAAGPALEGAQITCGCSSIPGAIDKVWWENDALAIHTIDGQPAVGICGSGLIDAVAVLLQQEIMDETGALDADVTLAAGVTLLQKDIRALQLAKAAIAAGIQTLLDSTGTTCGEIETFYLAGGFGSHLNLANAAAIGLIPEKLVEKTKVIGNAALAGAARLLLDPAATKEIRAIAERSRHFNLGGNPVFNGNYMEQMLFPFIE